MSLVSCSWPMTALGHSSLLLNLDLLSLVPLSVATQIAVFLIDVVNSYRQTPTLQRDMLHLLSGLKCSLGYTCRLQGRWSLETTRKGKKTVLNTGRIHKSTLNVKAIYSSETLISAYKATCCHSPENHNVSVVKAPKYIYMSVFHCIS
jgi:hypothetical protein